MYTSSVCPSPFIDRFHRQSPAIQYHGQQRLTPEQDDRVDALGSEWDQTVQVPFIDEK